MKMVEERLLRFAAPALYQRMVDTFSAFHLHPYDVQGTILKNEAVVEVTLRFSGDFSEALTSQFSLEQAENPDDEVTYFFKEAAEKCKSLLIADYFKMMKL
jgi:hypothetical protein